MKVGFVGLGAMGGSMAAALLDKGHELTVYNRTKDKAEPLRKRGARVVKTPGDAARDAEVVVTMLADDDAVRAVTLSDHGVLQGLGPDAVHVSSSTISVALANELEAVHAAAKRRFVSGTVFGRPEAAAAHQLWVLAAGPGEDVDRCLPILEAFGRGVTRLGGIASSANVVKLTGNLVIASMVEALGEAFALTRKAGIPKETFLEVFLSVFAHSPIFENYAKLIAREGYEPAAFPLPLMAKDVRLVLAAGDAMHVPMPLASLLRDQLLSALAQGDGHLDWSVIARLAARRAGL